MSTYSRLTLTCDHWAKGGEGLRSDGAFFASPTICIFQAMLLLSVWAAVYILLSALVVSDLPNSECLKLQTIPDPEEGKFLCARRLGAGVF